MKVYKTNCLYPLFSFRLSLSNIKDRKDTSTKEMGENENHVHSTRSSSSSSRKRDPKAHHPLPPSKKKRVPLGELTNSLQVTTNNSDYNISESKYAVDSQPPSTESSRVSNIETSPDIECEVEEGNHNDLEKFPSTESTKQTGLRRCSYASSIYRYLQSLEVVVTNWLKNVVLFLIISGF